MKPDRAAISGRRPLPMAPVLLFALCVTPSILRAAETPSSTEIRVSVTVDRGEDLGQCFGSLFEAVSDDGSFVMGAGFQNTYNTRYRGDRHAIHFFVRPTSGRRKMEVEVLPRPSDNLVGAYLFGRDGTVYSTYGGLKSWDSQARTWIQADETGGTHESMRVGNGTLAFADSAVSWNDRTILEPPDCGTYQLFFYANGHLCFYHVNRGDGPYRPFQSDEDGFSRLYACPWRPGEKAVDLSKAAVLRLPVVGETTFAWGQWNNQIVTGSNIGGFYVFEDGRWRMLREPQLNLSYQLYSSLGFHDRLLMGQYPTGRLFEYDGTTLRERQGWPPVPDGVSDAAREAQTTTIYGGDLMVGVWPWGELWRYNTDIPQWTLMRRMFTHPDLSGEIIHPYDRENRGNSPQNLWGQRVTSLVPSGPHLFIGTSAKAPQQWEPEKYPFLAPDRWRSYGRVYRATMPGHLSAPAAWTDGPTTLEFLIRDGQMSIRQDGVVLGTSQLSESLDGLTRQAGSLAEMKWGSGIYGPHGGVSLTGRLLSP